MYRILFILSLSLVQSDIMAQSDPLRPNYETAPSDTGTKDYKSKDSDDDAIKLNRDKLDDSNVIDTKDDQPVRSDTTRTDIPSEGPKENTGFSMRNGKVMSSNNGTLRMLDKDTILSNGLKVKSNGTVITKDGSKFTMNEGQFIDMSGNLILAKDSVQKRKH